jgi:hypothetical protein
LDSAKWQLKAKRLQILAYGPRYTPSSAIWFLLCLIVLSVLFPVSHCAPLPDQPDIIGTENREANCKIIYLGMVGALELANNSRSGLVQIRETLGQSAYPDVCAKTFSPYVWRSGLHYVLKHFPSHPGPLTQEDLDHAPKVVLVGHSMGGWAVISVARNLKSRGIPVELSIQVDSVGITDQTVPNNVKAAAIFHARDILTFMTTKKIRAEEPSQTKLLANVLVRGAGHESVTRDARIREMVMNVIESLRAAAAPPQRKD